MGGTRGASILVAAAVLLVAVPPAGAGRPAPSAPRTIEFSGYTWDVKSSSGKVGPGPNYFSSAPDNVWVDAQGYLHLRITTAKRRWYAAEVVNRASLGLGTYTWVLDSAVDALDPSVVLGLFTWNDDPAFNHRELDIEFARWGSAADPTNGQFVVQPYDTPGNLRRITQAAGATQSTQSFTWAKDLVSFSSSAASPSAWVYTGPDVPQPGGEHARINLWLFRGQAPTDRREVEVVIRSFTFTPGP